MSKNILFDDSDDEGDEVAFKTENEYAKKYDNWRGKEELYKLEQKYGNKDLESGSGSSDSEEDEEPPEIPEEVEAQFLKTLSLLKTKDPRIYDPSYKFFNEADLEAKKEEEKNDKEVKPKKEANSLAAAFADSDEEDDGGEIFKVEKKAPQPAKKENKVKEYLIGKEADIDPAEEQDLAPLRALWSDPKLDENEAFLRDYILNKRYLDRDANDVVDKLRDDEALEEDEKRVEEQGQFERAYNFRFEEPDQEYLKRYPRTMNSIRPKDDSRAKKRAEVKSRKEEEKKRKMEEIARMKALKLKEIQEKIAKIKQVTGNEELAFEENDIEGDFDPEEHDRRMRAIFDDDYYGDVDEEKPVFPDLDEELEIENWANFDEDAGDVPNGDGLHCEDDDFNMDADYNPTKARTTLMEEIKETLGKKRRNRKKKSKLAKILETEKPKYVPTEADKTYDQYMEEYYKMDCEDVIGGDLPTRFKYREVVPNSFGLSVEEILLADDKELNRWASLKKTVKYRPEHVEKSEVKTYQAKAADDQLKKKMIPSLFKDLPEEPEIVVPLEATKKKKKKKKKQNKEDTAEESQETEVVQDDNETDGGRKKKDKKEGDGEGEEVTTENNVEENVKERKKKKKNKPILDESMKESEQEISNVSITEHIVDENSKKSKKKKKNKKDLNDSKTENEQELSNASITEEKLEKNYKENKKKSNKSERINVEPSLNGEVSFSKQNRKRKTDNHSQEPFKKKNKNNKFKSNNKNETSDPLGKMSDERLKAYGLNPKKYRSFLKYKKH